MLTLRQITLARGTKCLLNNASVALHEKQKIGLIGHNGCGKTSLFSLILGKVLAEAGECLLNPQLRISHLSQQLPNTDDQALTFVLSGDHDYAILQARLQQAELEGDDAEIFLCHERLEQTGGYGKPAKAATIMAGLGFDTKEQQRPLNSFSGGWRMRLSLARCLMKPADLLLLDEPTNHLDMEAIFWLEKWLKQTASSIMVISHDREFLDAFVSHILHVDQQNLTLYTGNYSAFEKIRAQQLALQQAMYEKQQQKISHLMSYVNRFRAKATKAKQAQSRLKLIEKMDLVAQAQIDSPFSFNFYPCSRVSNPLIHCNKVQAGYESTIILKKLNFILNTGDRIALLGPNGEGKSTLIKTLIGDLPTLAGRLTRAENLQIGYYAQHQSEELDLTLSPVETIKALTPEAREQTIRDYLGNFNFTGDMATYPIHHFSGGEKARLALAKLVWLKPNLLLLDEPTNHLDLGMRAAIEIALQSYEGALILISHDRHLLRTTVDDFYLVYGQEVQPFKGDLEDYHQWLQSREIQPPTAILPSAASSSSSTDQYREKKSLQNRIKKLEQSLKHSQQQLTILNEQLSDLSLYDSSQESKLKTLHSQQKNLQDGVMQMEEEWLELVSNLEQLN